MMTCLFAGNAGAGIINADTIGAAIVDTLSAVAAERGIDAEIETPLVRDVLIDGAEELTMHIEIPGDDPLCRRVPVKISFLKPDGGIARVTTVIAQVRTYAVAAVAVTEIQDETPLAGGDIEFRRVDVTGIDGYISPDAALGDLQVKRRLKAGAILSEQTVERIPLVRRGESVTIHASVGSVTVTTEGTARQDGGRNEFIRVFTEATNKTITCRVIEPGLVIASR